MRLLAGLIARLTLVTLLCLATATAWVMLDTTRGIDMEAAASADRVVRNLRFDAWHEILWRGTDARLARLDLPEPEAGKWLSLISPGVCVSVSGSGAETRPICGAWGAVGSAAPRWFEGLFASVVGPTPPVARYVMLDGQLVGTVTARSDADAAVRQTWHRVRTSMGVATAMAAAIAVLASILFGHALRPTRMIVAGLRDLELGHATVSLPRFRTMEFDRIARAVDDLSRRLADITAQRAALMRRLFQVQEEERCAIARDLHDEFGQCLTATEALAGAIAAGAADRPDLAGDARIIGETAVRMMASLRGALAHLRPPDLEDIGLEASLRRLVGQRNTSGSSAVCRLDVAGDLADVPPEVALTLYRVTQEGLTNALKHGRPRHVHVRVERTHPEAVTLFVEDDGDGDPSRVDITSGQGLVGLRERVCAHGGRLSMARARAGLRLTATVPLQEGFATSNAPALSA